MLDDGRKPNTVLRLSVHICLKDPLTRGNKEHIYEESNVPTQPQHPRCSQFFLVKLGTIVPNLMCLVLSYMIGTALYQAAIVVSKLSVYVNPTLDIK